MKWISISDAHQGRHAGTTNQPTPDFGRPVDLVPRVLILASTAVRNQVRLLGLAVLVGIVAGVGAIFFYVATRGVEHYALGELAGYHPPVRPAGETEIPGLISWNQPFRPWLLLVIPTIGGILSGWLVYTFAPEAEGHGTDAVIAAYHNHQGQIRPRVPLIKIVSSALTIGSGGSGGREGPIAQICGRFRIAPGEPFETRRQKPPHSGGGGNGRRNCRDLPRPFGGRLVCRGSALLLSGVRTGSDHARRDCQRRFVLHVRAVCRLETALRDARSIVYESLAVGAVFAAGAVHDPAGHAVYPRVLRRSRSRRGAPNLTFLSCPYF